MIGKTLGHYQITEKLGEGGMGVVYKARDTHLDRFVAIKVLPAERVADPTRKARFVQEARAASALNHPNILHIYDIGQSGGTDFIAMEYVDGKTLGQLIGRKGLKLGDALKYGAQIAAGLAKAHGAGIVHRDLKPANVMVSSDGVVKLLDFGLAKLTEPGGSESEAPTWTMQPHTEEGTIVGTVAYMSPEQAEGKPVDARSDIFSFGSVLYEMVTGRRAFQGESKLATLSAILRHEPPPVSTLVAEMPPELEKLIQRCLRKDPERRIQHMADVKLALEDLKEESESGKLRTPGRVARRRPWLALAVAIVALVAGIAVTWRLIRSPGAPPAPGLTRLTYDVGLTTDPALSPDGKLLAYASDRGGAGNHDIWLQQVGGGEPVRLTNDAAEDSEPSFSPDGTRIVFRSTREGGGIYVIPALGGAARKIAPKGRRPVFSPDGENVAFYTGMEADAVLATANAQLYVVNPAGGTPREMRTGFSGACCPVWTPDGKHLLFLANRGTTLAGDESLDWHVVPLAGGPAIKTGVLDATRAKGLLGTVREAPSALIPGVWASWEDGVVFCAGLGGSTNLWQVKISSGAFRIIGEPRRLTVGTGFESQPSVAALPGGQRRVAFASLVENRDIWSLPVVADQAKVTGDPQRLTRSAADDVSPALSPDGKKLAFLSNRTGRPQVWLKNLETGAESAFSSSPSEKYGPNFSPDGSTLTYSGSTSGTWDVYISRLDGGGEEVLRDASPGVVSCWTPGREALLYFDVPGRTVLLDMGSHRRTMILAKTDHRLIGPKLSPDGRWIAFWDQSAGGHRSFVAPFRGPAVIEERDWTALSDERSAASAVHWSPGGNLVYFADTRDGYTCLWAQRLDPLTKRPSGPPLAIYHAHGASLLSEGGLSVASDRLAFAMAERTGNIWMAEFQ